MLLAMALAMFSNALALPQLYQMALVVVVQFIWYLEVA